MCLEIGCWSLFEPCLDRFHLANVADDLLQIWSIGQRIGAALELDEIHQWNEIGVSPCQLQQNQSKFTVLFLLSK